MSSLDTFWWEPKSLRLTLPDACTAGLTRLLNYLPCRAEERDKEARWPVEAPLLPPHEALSLSDLVHMALAWSPFSEPVEMDLFSHYIVLCDSPYLFHFSLLSGDPLLSALFSRYTKVMVLTADTHLLAVSLSARHPGVRCSNAMGATPGFPLKGTVWAPNTRAPGLTRHVNTARTSLSHVPRMSLTP